jgi:membrane-bound lytic murein transglycosylase D
MKKKATILVSIVLCSVLVNAQQRTRKVVDSAYLDKAFQELMESYDYISKQPLKIVDSLVGVTLPKELIAERLEVLNNETPFGLIYNDRVHAFVNLYINKKKDLSEKVLGLSDLYFPLIERILDEQGMPMELKSLAIVESALNPSARSRAGAVGLWQFMYATGRMYGLKTTSYVDDRQDPVKATYAACRYLGDLYKMYDNWELALAAYNSGPGNVNKAIRRSGGKKTYWEIYNYLPRETRGYVPAFIAVNYMLKYYNEHGLIPVKTDFKYFEVDTVHVASNITVDFLSKELGIEKSALLSLNPELKSNVIPGGNKPYAVILPTKFIAIYDVNRDSIHGKFKTVKPDIVAYKQVNESTTHRVRSGEVLGTIARRYGVSVRSLKSWNNLRSDLIKPGQRLTIHKKQSVPVNATAKAKTTVSAAKSSAIKEGNYVYYVIQPGDTLWDIANRHEGVTVSELKRINGVYNVKNLKPGQKIKISEKG